MYKTSCKNYYFMVTVYILMNLHKFNFVVIKQFKTIIVSMN